MVVRKGVDEVPPHRTVPVEFEMVQPVCRLHERRPLTDRGVRNADVVGRRADPDLVRRHAGMRRRPPLLHRFPDLGNEAIPVLRHRFDALLAGRAFAERMPEMRNVVSEIAFLDDGVGPQDVHQLVLPHEPSVLLDEHE